MVVSDIDFDEVSGAFSELKEKTSAPPRFVLSLKGDISRYATDMKLFVQADEHQVDLKKYQVKVIDNKSSLQYTGPHTLPYQNPKTVKP